ncbi:hypothetical protein OHB00_22290 [Streptomyces sp. NBC_00631]|uniref:hypothetical protein n=1 Tax=Streptomyces sp. NBC_00631 TaxID=2975793 RepID=UPI0030DFF6CE
MANTKNKRRQPGSIRPNGAGFQVRVYAGRDPLTKKDIYLHEQAETEVEAEKVRTKLLYQVDEKRHPKTQVTMSFLLDRWLGVAELDETSYERAGRGHHPQPPQAHIRRPQGRQADRRDAGAVLRPASGSARNSAKAGATAGQTPRRSRRTSASRSPRTQSSRFTSSCGPL